MAEDALILKTSDYEEIITDFDRDSFYYEWDKNSVRQISFTITRTPYNAFVYDLIQNEVLIIRKGQQYVIKQCTPKTNGTVQTKDVMAIHIMFTCQQSVYQYNTEGTDTNPVTMSISDVMHYYFDNNDAGFTWEVKGTFSKKQLASVGNGSGLDGINLCISAWNCNVFADNKHLILSDDSNWINVTNNQFRYLYNTDGVTVSVDTTSITNIVKCIGATKTDADGNDTGVYYFQPFFAQVQNSIDSFDKCYAPVIQDNRFTDQSSMNDYALSQLSPDPDVSLTLTYTGDQNINEGDNWLFIHEPMNFNTNVNVVSLKKYDYSKTNKSEVNFDNSIQNMFQIQQSITGNLQKALKLSINAMTTADGKNTIYQSSAAPTENLKVNDMWYKKNGDGTTTLMLYNGTEWLSPVDQAVQQAQTTAEGMNKNVYSNIQPDPTKYKSGDMWYQPNVNTDGTTTYKVYEWNNNSWSDMFDDSAYQAQLKAKEAEDLANSKAKTFTEQPNPPYNVGDLWAESGFTQICTTARNEGDSFNQTDWILQKLVIGSLDPSVQSTLDNSDAVGKINLSVWARHYMNSPMIVTNPNDPVYVTVIGFTNMSHVLGGAFNGISQENDDIQGGIDTPATAWALINMVKLYKVYGDPKYLDKVNLIANYFVSHLIDCTYYGSAFKAMPNEYSFDWDQMDWVPKTSIIQIRSFYHTIWALLEAYSISPVAAYKTAAQELLDGVAIFTENIKARIADNEILPYMVGSQYNAITSTDGSAFVQDMTNSFNLTSLDVIVKSVQKYVELFGNETRTNDEGVSYTVQGIMDDAVNHVVTMYNSYGLRRTDGHNLLYCFEHFEWTDTPDSLGRYTAIPMNWDYNNNIWGVDEWFTGDLEFWMIKGLTYSGHTDIASSLMSRYYQLRVHNTADNDLLFYDTMDKDGQPYNGDTSMSISFTGLFLSVEDELGNASYNQQCAETLLKYQIVSADKAIDGGYPWDISTVGQMVEGKTLGEIIYSPLEKANVYYTMSDVLNGSPVTYSIAGRVMQAEQGIISSVQKGTSYNGVVIDKNGMSAIAGAVDVHLNSSDGFKITNGDTIIFQADTNGDLLVNGSGTFSGNLSAVDLQGNNLTLSGALDVTGSISAANNGVVINNNGLAISKGSLNLQNTQIDSSGNLTTINANITGTINATSGNITGDLNVTGSLNGGTLNGSSLYITSNQQQMDGTTVNVKLGINPGWQHPLHIEPTALTGKYNHQSNDHIFIGTYNGSTYDNRVNLFMNGNTSQIDCGQMHFIATGSAINNTGSGNLTGVTGITAEGADVETYPYFDIGVGTGGVGGLRVVTAATFSSGVLNYADIYYQTAHAASKAEFKQDISKISDSVNALDLINQASIYKFHYKTDVQGNRVKWIYGPVIGAGYVQSPDDFLDYQHEGTDDHSAAWLGIRGIQELYTRLVSDEEEINQLKQKTNS